MGTDDLCRIRWWYIRINGRSENASLALWAITVDFQYHIMGHLCNDYPQMVITYCCLVKGNPGLIWLHVNRVYIWESVSRVWEWQPVKLYSLLVMPLITTSNRTQACFAVWSSFQSTYSTVVLPGVEGEGKGPILSSTRLIRKVSQFRRHSFYVVPTAHVCVCVWVCVCVCVCMCVCNTWNKYVPHHIQWVLYRHATAMLMTM